jgi:hypothetical protein
MIDHHFYVPAGMRNSETRLFSEFKYYSLGAMKDAGHPATKHQVFLAHGCVENGDGTLSGCLVDEQFYFEDVGDARWFWTEGYKRMLYEGEKYPDRMALWIDDHEAENRGYDKPICMEENNEQHL